MSNHKCRYCANASLIDDDLIYCDIKRITKEKKNCISDNKCKNFIFNEIDVFNLTKTYKPKTYKPKSKKNNYNQIDIFEVWL